MLMTGMKGKSGTCRVTEKEPISAATDSIRVYLEGGTSPTLKESLVLLSGCLHMTKLSRRHTMKMTERATMFHTAVPPCTAKTLNARISSPAREPCVCRFHHPKQLLRENRTFTSRTRICEAFGAPTEDRGAHVDRETREFGRLGVVREQQGLEAESFLQTWQHVHTGVTVAQLRLLRRARHHQAGPLRLVSEPKRAPSCFITAF